LCAGGGGCAGGGQARDRKAGGADQHVVTAAQLLAGRGGGDRGARRVGGRRRGQRGVGEGLAVLHRDAERAVVLDLVGAADGDLVAGAEAVAGRRGDGGQPGRV